MTGKESVGKIRAFESVSGSSTYRAPANCSWRRRLVYQLSEYRFGFVSVWEGEVVSYAWCESERLDSHARRHWIFVSETLVAIEGFALRTQRQIGHQQTTHKIMSIESNRSAVWLLLSQVNSPVRGHQWLFAISHPYRGGRE